MTKQKLAIVPAADIPKASNCPTDNLLQVYKICLGMEQVCTENSGVGLSAVQVGVPWKLYIVRDGSGYRYFVDCEYKGAGDKFDSLEGCLSLKNVDGSSRHFIVSRFRKVVVSGKELVFVDSKLALKEIDLEFGNLAAVIHQHEIDHHNDILISEIGKEYLIWEQ
jgi:peptide deformylase